MTATRTAARQSEPEHRPAPARYEDDPYSWALEQAALLRAGKLEAIDAAHIAEEMDEVAGAQYDKLESALRLIVMHMLKWDHQPARRSRSWAGTILVQRKHVQKVLRKNPGLKPHIQEALEDGYDVARAEASVETGLVLERFPEPLPYTYDDIMTRDHPWPPADQPSPRKGRRGR